MREGRGAGSFVFKAACCRRSDGSLSAVSGGISHRIQMPAPRWLHT